jgi:iron(III) transport system ATP-binding protein
MGQLVVESLAYDYHKETVIKQVSLEVASHELVCLIGASGCGKSTLLRLIAGLQTPLKGRVLIDDHCVFDRKVNMPPEKRGVGLVFQHPALFPHLTVAENIAFAVRQLPASEKKALTQERMAQVQLEGKEKHYPHMLSGGEQQRVALGRALMTNPSVMLLDEAFANLDVLLRKQVRDEMVQLLKSLDVATLLVTHDPEEAIRVADRLYILEQGNIVQKGRSQSIYAHPKTFFAARLFGDVNCIAATVVQGMCETVFGKARAEGYADGVSVNVCFRPEDCALVESGRGCQGIVKETHFLGHHSLIYIQLEEKQVGLHVRTSSAVLPAVGDRVNVDVDMQNLMLFASNKM